MALEKELETYKRELPNLIGQHAGKFVLIGGDRVSGIWGTYRDALQEGYRLYGLNPFLVKQIQASEIVHHMLRDIHPLCRS